jgi:hypothetical protein
MRMAGENVLVARAERAFGGDGQYAHAYWQPAVV